MGIDERVLSALQQSWEAKLAASRVADFEQDARMAPFAQYANQQAALQAPAPGSSSNSAGPRKAEPKDSKSGVKESSSGGQGGTGAGGGASTSNNADEDELGSDLDDLDDEDDADLDANAGIDNGDYVIALYEKVTRVKNKWKIQLKNGVISADGKDYLFEKCNGDLEW